MKFLKRLFLVFSAVCSLSSTPRVSAQVGIGGVADKTVYGDRVTFTITNQAGYDYNAQLDGVSVPVGAVLEVTNADYHELSVFRTNAVTGAVGSQRVRFIVSATERSGSEDGLPPWTPNPVIPSGPDEFASARLVLMAPRSFPSGYPVPMVAWVENSQGHPVRVNGIMQTTGGSPITIRRGTGSGFLAATNAGQLEYRARLAELESQRLINIEAEAAWVQVSGTLSANSLWPPGSRIQVTGALTNPPGATLTIGAGTVVRLAPGVDIHNLGTIAVDGTVEDPVVFMPAIVGQPWGGFVQHADNAALTAHGTIFTGSGANQGCWFTGHGCSSSLSGITSHRSEQALISLKGANCNLLLADCAAIDLAGQFGHSAGGVGGSYRITLNRFLMQRCTTGGEYTDASFTVNDSAFIECPNDTGGFVDGDNDGLYLVNGNHAFTNSLWGWTKDDGVDSGGSGAGVLTFQSCWFESVFHEGNSLSGTGKNVTHYQSVFLDCGQGLECGYDGPTGTMAGCLASGNLVGARFGDNYPWSYSGFLRVTNSMLLNNYRDVWGMNWQDWTYRTSAMDVRSNWLSRANLSHPDNAVWQADQDGSRLAFLMTTPPNALVGVGLGWRGTQVSMDALSTGVPIRLSSFATHFVSVDYVVEFPGGTVASGTVSFAPGEISKLTAPVWPPPSTGLVRILLRNPAGASITGLAEAIAVRNAAWVPAGANWKYLDAGTNAGTAWREPQYDDSGWRSGRAELGYGDTQVTEISYGANPSAKHITYYFRHAFTIPNAADWSGATVGLKRDDGGIVYLNGSEVFRSNITNAVVNFLTPAFLAEDDGTVFYSTNVPASLLRTGTNVLAVEIHQESITSSDVSFDLRFEGNPRLEVKVLKFGQDLRLCWTDPAARLEAADEPGGPWTSTGLSSPAPLDTTAPQKFYRVFKP